MKRKLKAILYFYRKLVVPTLALAMVAGLVELLKNGIESFFIIIGLSYIVLAPLTHYFIYEIKYKAEYYFYYNLGISRLKLWLSTITLNIIVGLILVLL